MRHHEPQLKERADGRYLVFQSDTKRNRMPDNDL